MKSEMQDQYAQIERQCDATKAICKSMLPLSQRAQRRLIAYFLDLIDERSDMGAEKEIMQQVAAVLGLNGGK